MHSESLLVVHGDSHFFRTDKPLPARVQGALITPSIENFTRLETFGTPNHHWVEVSVDPNDPNQVIGLRSTVSLVCSRF